MLDVMFSSLFNMLTSPHIMGLMLIGVLIGIWVGITPGIGGRLSIALAIPFVFGMPMIAGAVFLFRNVGNLLSRGHILETVWGRNPDLNTRTVDTHISRLRSKLGRLANTVRTVRGQGYRFYEHPEVVVWAAPEYSI